MGYWCGSPMKGRWQQWLSAHLSLRLKMKEFLLCGKKPGHTKYSIWEIKFDLFWSNYLYSQICFWNQRKRVSLFDWSWSKKENCFVVQSQRSFQCSSTPHWHMQLSPFMFLIHFWNHPSNGHFQSGRQLEPYNWLVINQWLGGRNRLKQSSVWKNSLIQSRGEYK